jgi:hypothetical protein
VRRGLLLALAALLLLGAGALVGALVATRGDDDGEAAPATTRTTTTRTETTTTVEEPWVRCRNDDLGYSIAHPPDWHEEHCAFFDPEPFEVPENSDFYGVAMEVQVAQDSFRNIVRGLTDPRFARVVSRQDLSVNGRPGVLVETEATGEGLFERGYRIYAYVLDLDGRPPVIVQATRGPGEAWGGRKEIADLAVTSLRVDRAAPAPDLPPAVAEKRAAMLDAALAGDYDQLEGLADPDQFTYTFGGPHPDGPAAFWRESIRPGEREPAELLVALLELPPARTEGIYVWPFAYDRRPASLTAEERRSLRSVASPAEIEGWIEAGSYLGWRVGITADGRWTFFVAGD